MASFDEGEKSSSTLATIYNTGAGMLAGVGGRGLYQEGSDSLLADYTGSADQSVNDCDLKGF